MIVKYKHIVVKDGDMYRVLYPDRVLSEDSYNLSWAKHHARELTKEAQKRALAEELANMPSSVPFKRPPRATEKATGALFLNLGT